MSYDVTIATLDRCLSLATLSPEVEDASQAVLDARMDWVALISLANKHLVVPALWTGLQQACALPQIPEDVQSYVALLHTRNRARNERIRDQCLEIGLLLKKIGIRAVLLKGATWLFDDSS